jgi:transcriptional regulator with XRE-family HTH domain
MEARSWNIPRLAEACDVNPGLVARWVTNNRRYRVTPSPTSCEKIAAALGADLDDVLELAGHRHRPASDQRGEPDLIEQGIRQGIADMYDVLDGIPRPMWGTVIKLTFSRAVDGARDMARLLSEGQSASGPVRSPVEASNKRHNKRRNSHQDEGGEKLVALSLGRGLQLATS